MKYSYEEVIEIIQNTRRFGNATGRDVSMHMLEQLGNPQVGIPFVHIAGTNGKGSTTAFLCEILKQTGKKIGMFTSPHLITFRERIRIDGEYIGKEDVTRLGNLLLDKAFDLPPTMFDYCLAMAVLYFKEQKVDLMVIETGIGGRFDSTNALGVPEVAVITKIGLDHTALLGETIEQIAGEKAGIMKKGAYVVLQTQEEAARNVLIDYFSQLAQPTELLVEVSQEDLCFAKSLPRKMLGTYQEENAATAILAARCIFQKWEVEQALGEQYVRDGIQHAIWKGRMELINEAPFFMIDGAHNSHGVHALAESLKALFPGEKFRFIMGVMADKDYEEMIEELIPLAVDFVTVTPESNRALQSKDLAECIQQKGVPAKYVDDMEEVIRPLLPTGAVTIVKKQEGEHHIYLTGAYHKTIAFGSLYFIGAIETMLEENRTS